MLWTLFFLMHRCCKRQKHWLLVKDPFLIPLMAFFLLVQWKGGVGSSRLFTQGLAHHLTSVFCSHLHPKLYHALRDHCLLHLTENSANYTIGRASMPIKGQEETEARVNGFEFVLWDPACALWAPSPRVHPGTLTTLRLALFVPGPQLFPFPIAGSAQG